MLKHIIGLWLTHKLMPIIKALMALFLLEYWIKEISGASFIDSFQSDVVAAHVLMWVFGIVHAFAAYDYWTYGDLQED